MALHGKFEPSATRGLLSGLPYGGGVAMIICPLAVVKKAMAEAARRLLIEYMFVLTCALFPGDWFGLVCVVWKAWKLDVSCVELSCGVWSCLCVSCWSCCEMMDGNEEKKEGICRRRMLVGEQ